MNNDRHCDWKKWEIQSKIKNIKLKEDGVTDTVDN